MLGPVKKWRTLGNDVEKYGHDGVIISHSARTERELGGFEGVIET